MLGYEWSSKEIQQLSELDKAAADEDRENCSKRARSNRKTPLYREIRSATNKRDEVSEVSIAVCEESDSDKTVFSKDAEASSVVLVDESDSRPDDISSPSRRLSLTPNDQPAFEERDSCADGSSRSSPIDFAKTERCNELSGSIGKYG